MIISVSRWILIITHTEELSMLEMLGLELVTYYHTCMCTYLFAY